MAVDPDRLQVAITASLAQFAQLREQARKDGPVAVLGVLDSMSEAEIRQILWALIVTSATAEEEPS